MRAPLRSGGRLEATWVMASTCTSTSSSESNTARIELYHEQRQSFFVFRSPESSSTFPAKSKANDKLPKGKRHARGTQLSDPKSVSPKQRVSD